VQSGPPARVARFCTRCGLARPDGARYCPQCGAPFEDIPATAPAALVPAPVEEAPTIVYPVAVDLPFQPQASRLGTGFRLPLALPYVLLWLLLVLLSLVTTPVAWLAALATGRQPRALHRLHAAMLRYTTRTAAYLFLATGAAPALPWQDGEPHPVAVATPERGRLPRLRTLLLGPLALPAVLTSMMFAIVTIMLAAGAWAAILVTGRLPRTIHDMQQLAIPFQSRTLAFVPLLLMAKYPWYERDGVLVPARRG
jgi:hypothetical protein